MSTDRETLIERIKARRIYADRPVTDSDNSERSPANTTAETSEESQQDAPTREHRASDKKPNPNGFEKSTELYPDASNNDIEGSVEDFQTMMAEALTDSEEENDKVHTCIDFADMEFKGTLLFIIIVINRQSIRMFSFLVSSAWLKQKTKNWLQVFPTCAKYKLEEDTLLIDHVFFQ